MVYFTQKLNKGFVLLFTSQAIRKTALSLLSVFLPIFLFQIFDENFFLVLAFFGVAAALYAGFLPLGMQFMNRFGFKRAIILGSSLGMLYFAILAFTDKSNALFLIPIAIGVSTLFKLFYWIPYHVDFAKFADPHDRGKGVSLLFALVSFAGVVGPIVAGYILDQTSFGVLFGVSVLLYAFSLGPLFKLPEVNESYRWGYKETWRKLFSREYRDPFIAITALGVENIIAVAVWPLFIYLLLKGDLFDVGAVSTIIFGAVVILQLGMGKFLDVGEGKRYQTLHVGSIFSAIGWVGKMFVVTAFHIFIAGFYHGITKIFTETPFDTLVYEIAADQGHYVDEFTVLKEMALHLGHIIGIFGTALILLFFPIEWTFAIAAGATLLFNLLYYKKKDVHMLAQHKAVSRYQLHH
ncbi:MAG: MFS transporter [Parcubacteria group bacterium]|nr:MFS transporter [Parcubacteria group bacterium]